MGGDAHGAAGKALTLTLILALALALAHPCSRQYAPANPAGHAHTPQVIAIVMSLPPLVLVDYTICAACCPNPGARWFLLHALGNFVVAVLCVPDFVHTAHNPPAAMSVAYCASLPSYGQGLLAPCSDWPTCIIIAMHLYHMLSFQLDANDMFHHLLFVPIIGGMNFFYPNGAVANILSFFISGLPGGVSYLLLAMVKTGHVSAFSEKRVSCSINTWLRGSMVNAPSWQQQSWTQTDRQHAQGALPLAHGAPPGNQSRVWVAWAPGVVASLSRRHLRDVTCL